MKRQTGLTLVEVLIAMVLLGIVGGAIIALFPSMVQVNQQSSEDQQETVVAKQFFELVRASWTDTSPGVTDTVGKENYDAEEFEDSSGQLQSFPYSLANSSCTATVANPDVAEDYRRRVTVTCLDPTTTFSLDLGEPLE